MNIYHTDEVVEELVEKLVSSCNCDCHKMPGVRHVMACCRLSGFHYDNSEVKEMLLESYPKQRQE